MRLLTTGIAALVVSTFALAPAHACSWGKTAKAKDMTVAETTVAPEIDTDISIATNDLSDQVLQEMTVPEVETEEPAE
ncbi:hypothetical protein [Roseibium sp.]|uniref:hypothetical protein n=1 Tax=Roseibium sp. TaxID=1936156 RepID=UPI00391AADAB